MEDKRIYSFRLSPQNLMYLGWVTQSYLLACLDRPLKSLEFLNSVLPEPQLPRKPEDGHEEQAEGTT